MRARLLFSSALFFVLPVSLLADTTYTYTYTGNPFTVGYESELGFQGYEPLPFGSYDSTDFVTGTFTLSYALGANFADASLTPITFDFTDGPYQFSNPTTAYIEVWTDGNGNITNWYIFEEQPVSSGMSVALYSESGVGTTQDGGEDLYGSAAFIGAVLNDPGTWTMSVSDTSATPEPSSLALLGTGVLGLAGLVRRRFAGHRS